MTASRPPTPDQQPNPLWSRRWRIIVSVLVIGHLLAVATPPLAFQANGPLGLSPAVETVLAPIEQYSQFMYLDRGYAFFAPDPGPSHLFQAGLTDSSGNLTEKMYPDLEQQWPRLLYHRHFMLAEYLNDVHQPPGPPAELVEADPEAAANWRNSRARYEHLRMSMAQHLEHTYPGRTAAIRRIEHLIPDLIEYQEQPIALNDPRMYEVLLDQPTALVEGNLVAPDRAAEEISVPEGLQPKQPPPSGSQQPDPATSDSEAAEQGANAPARQRSDKSGATKASAVGSES